jgi:hypothetical protein
VLNAASCLQENKDRLAAIAGAVPQLLLLLNMLNSSWTYLAACVLDAGFCLQKNKDQPASIPGIVPHLGSLLNMLNSAWTYVLDAASCWQENKDQLPAIPGVVPQLNMLLERRARKLPWGISTSWWKSLGKFRSGAPQGASGGGQVHFGGRIGRNGPCFGPKVSISRSKTLP